MGRKAVPQPVRTHFYGNTGMFQMFLDDPRYAPCGDTRTAVIEKHRRVPFARPLPAPVLLPSVVSQRLEGDLADRHDPLLRSLAEDADDAELEVDVRPIKPD